MFVGGKRVCKLPPSRLADGRAVCFFLFPSLSPACFVSFVRMFLSYRGPMNTKMKKKGDGGLVLGKRGGVASLFCCISTPKPHSPLSPTSSSGGSSSTQRLHPHSHSQTVALTLYGDLTAPPLLLLRPGVVLPPLLPLRPMGSGGAVGADADAAPYATMPATASAIPAACFTEILSPSSAHPPSSTATVLAWPSTWNDTAEKRPRHANWDTLTATAAVHEMRRVRAARDVHA